MRRLPLVASFVLFIALCASLAYWGLQLFKPPLRPVTAPPRAMQAEIQPEAANVLFGGRRGPAAIASNYQLKGVIFSGNPHDSVAIIAADGKPGQAIRVNAELMPGVTIKEVHRDYVLLSEGGTVKRIELPESAKGQVDLVATTPMPAQRATIPAPGQAIPPRGQTGLIPTPPVVSAPIPPPTPAPPSIPAAAPQPLIPGQAIPGQVQSPSQPGMAPPPTVVVSPPPSSQSGGGAATPGTTAMAPPVSGFSGGVSSTPMPATPPASGDQSGYGIPPQPAR